MNSFHRFLGICFVLSNLSAAFAQPTSQPKVLTIIREHVKIGRSAHHSKFERGYPAAFEKAKWPDYSIAITSMTGPSEAWYLLSNDSMAAIEESDGRIDKDPVLSAELNRLDTEDAENIDRLETIRAMGRPDLSVGAFPDIAKARFFNVGTFRIRPGKEFQFAEVAKAYATAIKRVAPNTSYRVYEVIAGMPQPTFLFFSSSEKYGEFDQRKIDGAETFKQATAEEQAAFKNFSEVAQSVENNHFRVDPGQSYVSKETREKDPTFWNPK